MADGLITIGIVPDDSQWTRTMRHLASNSSRTINQAINAHVQPLGKITGEANEFQKSLAASNARVIAFGASTGAIFAVRAAFRQLVASTIEVEKEMVNINAIFQLGGQQLKRFSNDLFSVASAYSTAFSDAAQAAAEFARQGLTVEETLKRTAAALALSRISVTNMEQSVASLTSILNTFVKESLTAEEVVNRLVAVDQAYAVSAGDLAEALSRVSSSAADANVSLNQTMALITAAKQITARTGSVIGNSFKTMFTRLQRPQVIDDLESVGIKARDAQGALRPMMDILRALASQYDSLATSQKSFIAETVGGVYQINILKAIMRDLGGGMSIVDGAMQAAGNSTDMVNKRMEMLNNTISGQLIKTANSLKQAMSATGTITLGGSMKAGLGSFETFIKDLSFLIDSNVAQGGDNAWKSLGANLAQGLLKGIGNALRGPGLQYIVLAMFKLFQRLSTFVYESTKELMNLNQQEKNRQAINQDIARWLGEQKQVLMDVLNGQLTLNQATEMYLSSMKGAVSAAKDLQSVSSSMGEIAVTQVNFTPKPGAATGYIPALEIAEARRGGYAAGSVVNTKVSDGNRAFDVTANTAETITRIIHEGRNFDFINPKEGSPAANAHRAESMRRTGIDPYAFPQSQVRAGGFIPNLALSPELVETIHGLGIDIPRDILGTKDTGASRYKMDAFLSLPENMVTTFMAQYRSNPRALKAILSSMMRKGSANIPLNNGPAMAQWLAGAMLNRHAVDNNIYPGVTPSVIENLAGMFTGKPTVDVKKQEAALARTVKLRPQDVQRMFNLHAATMPFIAAYEHGADPMSPARDRPNLVTPLEFTAESTTHKFQIPTPIFGFKGSKKLMETFNEWKEMLRQSVGKTSRDFPAGQLGTMRGNYFELALKAMAEQEGIGVAGEESDVSPLDIYGSPQSILSQTNIKGKVSGLELKAGALEAMKSGNMAKKIFRTLAGEPGSSGAKPRLGGPVGYVPKLVNIRAFEAAKGGIGIIDADALSQKGIKGSAFESLVYAAVATGKPLRIHYGPMTTGKTTAAERIVNAVGGLGKAGGDYVSSLQDIDSDRFAQFIINKTDVSNLDTGVFGLALSAASQIRTFHSPHKEFLGKQQEMIDRLKARNRNDEARNAEAIARKHDEKLWNQYAENITGLGKKFGSRASPYDIKTPLAAMGFVPNLALSLEQIYDTLVSQSHEFPASASNHIFNSPQATNIFESDWKYVGHGAESIAFRKGGLVFKVPRDETTIKSFAGKAMMSIQANQIFEKAGLDFLKAKRVRVGSLGGGKGLFQRFAGTTIGSALSELKTYDEKSRIYRPILQFIDSKMSALSHRERKAGGYSLGVDTGSENNFTLGNPEGFKKLAFNALRRAPRHLSSSNTKLMELLLKVGQIKAIDLAGYGAAGFIPNLYYAAAEAIDRENRATSGRAMLGSDISLRTVDNPLGIAAYDSRQGSVKGAIAQHRAVGQDMSDIRYAHTAARGKIPNLALLGEDPGSGVGGFRDTGGMYGSIGIFSSVILAALMGMRGQSAIPSEASDRRRLKDNVLNRLLVSDAERASAKLRILTKEFDEMRGKLMKGEEAVSSFGSKYKGAADIPRMEADLGPRIAALRKVVQPHEEALERRRIQLSRAGQFTAWGASLGGGMATQFAQLSSASMGAAVNEFSNGLTQAGQVLLTFPNKLGVIGALTFAVDSMVSAIEVYVKGLHNAQRAFEVSQDKFTKTTAQMDALAASLNQYESMIADSSVSFEAITREQRKYSETLAQLSSSTENTRLISRLAGATDTRQRQAIIMEERERGSHRLGVQAGALGLHEYAARRMNIIGGIFGVQPFGYSNVVQKQQLEQTMRGTATEAISVMSNELKARLMATNSLDEFTAALEAAKNSTNTDVKDSAQFLADSFKDLAKLVKSPGMRVLRQQIFGQLQIERYDTTPERQAARERLLKANAARQREIDDAMNRERLAQRMFLNAGALLGGRELDIKQLSSQMRLQRSLVGGGLLGATQPSVSERQSLAGIMRLFTGERSIRQYEAATESQRIEAERIQKVEAARGESTRAILDHLSQSFDAIVGTLPTATSAYSKGAGLPTLVEWRQNIVQALNQGLQVALTRRGIGPYLTNTGTLDTEKLIKAIVQGGGGSRELQGILTKGLQANIGSMDISKSILDVSKQIANINLDAFAEQQKNNTLLAQFTQEMNFKQMSSYLGGIKSLLDRGSRRTVERDLIRGITLMNRAVSPEARALGAATFLKALKEMQIPLDRSGTSPLSQAINQAFNVGISNFAVVQQQMAARVVGAVGRLTGGGLATAAAMQLGGRAGIGTAAAAFESEFLPENQRMAQQSMSTIQQTTNLFDSELSKSANALSTFTDTVESLRTNWEKAFLDARGIREQMSAAIGQANRDFYGSPEGRPGGTATASFREDTTGQKAALMLGRPGQTLATFAGVTLASMLFNRFRRGGAAQQKELTAALEQVAGVGGASRFGGGGRGFSSLERSMLRESQVKAAEFAQAQKAAALDKAWEEARAVEEAMFRPRAKAGAIRVQVSPQSQSYVPQSMRTPTAIDMAAARMPIQEREWFLSQNPSEQKRHLHKMAEVAKDTARRTMRGQMRERWENYKKTFFGEPTIYGSKPEDFLRKPPIGDIEATKAYEADLARVKANPANRAGRRAWGRLQERFGGSIKTGLVAAAAMMLAQSAQAGQGGASEETSPFSLNRGDLTSLGIQTAGYSTMFGGGLRGLTNIRNLQKGGVLALSGLASGRLSEALGGGIKGELAGGALDIAIASKLFGVARGGGGTGIGIASELLRRGVTERYLGYTAGAGQGMAGAMLSGATFGGPFGAAIAGGIYGTAEGVQMNALTKALLSQGRVQDASIMAANTRRSVEDLTQENVVARAGQMMAHLRNRESALMGLQESDAMYSRGWGGKMMGLFGISPRQFGPAESTELETVRKQIAILQSGAAPRDANQLIAVMRELNLSIQQSTQKTVAKELGTPGSGDVPTIQSDINVKISVEDYDKIPTELNEAIVRPLAQNIAYLNQRVNELLNARSPRPAQVVS